MTIELRPLTAADAEAHCAGEDELTVRWLTGGYGDVEGTVQYFEWLAGNADRGVGKRGFGIWKSGRLCGYIDFTPDLDDGLDPEDVALAYAVRHSIQSRHSAGRYADHVQPLPAGLVETGSRPGSWTRSRALDWCCRTVGVAGLAERAQLSA